MTTWFRAHGTHFFLAIGLVMLPLLYVKYNDVSWYPLDPYEHLIQNGLAYILLMLFCYFNYTLFVPYWYLTKRYTRYALVTISCLWGVVWLSHRIEQWVFFKTPRERTFFGWSRQILWAENMFVTPPTGEPFGHQRTRTLTNPDVIHSPLPQVDAGADHPPGPRRGPGPWIKMTLIFLVGGISTLLSSSIQVAAYLRQVEKEQLAAELRQLKAQLYPHFLFNTLNSLYALAIRKDDRTPDMIVKLSEFMRYMIRDAHRHQVPLTTETTYMTNYIDLQKTRLRDVVQVDFRVEGDTGPWQIAPLLLFTFLENAFKYGVNPKTESLISIGLSVQNGELHFRIANQKLANPVLDESMGVGLQNARDRLALLYPDAHQLTIHDTPTSFTVDLTLHLI